MKKGVMFLVSVLMVFLLVGCKGGRADAEHEGKWLSVKGEALGIAMTGEDIAGFGLELQSGGKGTVSIEGESDSVKWTNDDTTLTLKISGQDVVGTLGEDTITFMDMFGMGLDLTFAKEGTPAADPINYLPENDKLMIGTWESYSVEDASGEVDPAALKMTFTQEHMFTGTYLGEDLGEYKWSLLDDFGSFDSESEAGIIWDIEGQEIKVTYTRDDKYYVFNCKKAE